jgi:hypothetical protein
MGKGLAVPDETGEMRIANGVAMIDSSELDETAAAIAEVAQTRNGIKFKFHDKASRDVPTDEAFARAILPEERRLALDRRSAARPPVERNSADLEDFLF